MSFTLSEAIDFLQGYPSQRAAAFASLIAKRATFDSANDTLFGLIEGGALTSAIQAQQTIVNTAKDELDTQINVIRTLNASRRAAQDVVNSNNNITVVYGTANPFVGPTGPASTVPGPTGPAGNIGPTGAQGAVGLVGSIGPTGPVSNALGPQGPQGVPGGVGPTGPQGAAGAAGVSNVPGPTGPTGAVSTVAGPTGPQGAAGSGSISGLTSDGVSKLTVDSGYRIQTGFYTPSFTYTHLNTTISTARQRFGTASLLNGTTGWLRIGDLPLDGFIGAWTIELFVYPTSLVSPWSSVISVATPTGNYILVGLLPTTGRTLTYISSGGNGSYDIANNVSGTTNAAINTWHHIALVYTGAAYITYLNGVEQSRATTALTVPPIALANSVQLMSWAYRPSEPLVSGNIDELRISSVARYTGSTYTVPTAEFTNDDTTVLLHHFNGTNGSTAWATSGQDVTFFSDAAASMDANRITARDIYTPTLTAARAMITGALTSNQSTELLMDMGTASGSTIVVDANLGGLFFITPANGTNITLNITNVPTNGAWRSYNFTVVIATATNKVFVNALQVNGSAATLVYSGGVSSVSVSSATYVVQTFNLIYNSTVSAPLTVFTSVSSMT